MTVHDAAGDRVGVVVVCRVDEGVQVRAWLHSLAPGFRGFHVHQTGLCDPAAPAGPFTTAGGHLAGGDVTHGDHAGDMPSLIVTASGKARLAFVTDRFSIADLRDADGSAVMVHAGRDNFANIPDRYAVAGVAGPDAMTRPPGTPAPERPAASSTERTARSRPPVVNAPPEPVHPS